MIEFLLSWWNVGTGIGLAIVGVVVAIGIYLNNYDTKTRAYMNQDVTQDMHWTDKIDAQSKRLDEMREQGRGKWANKRYDGMTEDERQRWLG